MAIPKLKKENVIEAIKFIDKNGIPPQYQSTQYDLISEDNKKYPPKYVIAVANHIENKTEITTDSFNADEAKKALEKLGFRIENKHEKYILTITADNATSTDESFSMDDLGAGGDKCIPLDVVFIRANGEEIRRKRRKGERRICNQTLPKLALQEFEKQITALSAEEKENFPVSRYSLKDKPFCGIFSSVEEFKKHRNSIECMVYHYGEDKQYVIYCWNIFSTIEFVQECLKRFGEPEDKFILTYREKDKKETEQENDEKSKNKESNQQSKGYQNPYSQTLIESKNIIFHGAPGTGKSHLAREIAADIISDGYYNQLEQLDDEQKKQVEFVQFHPSYDYTDFVEGLRPRLNPDGSMYFDRVDGIFMKFVDEARKNYENSQKTKEVIEKEVSAQETLTNFLFDVEAVNESLKTIKNNEFEIKDFDDKVIRISIPKNEKYNEVVLKIDKLREMLESDVKYTKVAQLTSLFKTQYPRQEYSYYFKLYQEIEERKKSKKAIVKKEELKKYLFIIDEINRGEISKIFGELFFSIDPGYRGKTGEISTQYANLHDDPEIKFYIPENVYIIGTMNDIDRSVDSFDFAMRRRFRFIEIKADACLEMLDDLNDEELKEEAIRRMTALNNEIAKTDELNEDYQIGAAYFLKLKTLSFDQLWTDYLQPLLKEYIQGMYDEANIMKRFEKAYGYEKPNNEDDYESTENQG